jgi:hypothetical protein
MADEKMDSLTGWMRVIHEASTLRRQAEADRKAAARMCIDNTLALSIPTLEKVKMLFQCHKQGHLDLNEFMETLETVLELDVSSDE